MSNVNEDSRYESKSIRYKDGKGGAYTILITRFNGDGVWHLDDEVGFGGEYCVFLDMAPGPIHADYDPRRFVKQGPMPYQQDLVDFLRPLSHDDEQWEMVDEGMEIHRDDFRDETHVEGE